jgi:hypothetical protein
MERRTGTGGSDFSTSAGSGSVPILLSWLATTVMSAATLDGAVLLFETKAADVPLADPEADAQEPIRIGLHEVEAELDAAKTLIELNAAAKKLTRASRAEGS